MENRCVVLPPDDERRYHVETHLSPLERWRHAAEIAAFTIAALWGIYVFVYQERIKPAAEPMRLQTSVVLAHDAVEKNAEFVKVTLNLQNLGTRPVLILGYSIDVYGRRVLATRHRLLSDKRGTLDLYRSLNLSPPELLRSMRTSFGPVVGADQLRHVGLALDESWPVDITFVIPRGSYQVANVVYGVIYTTGDDLRPVTLQTVHSRDGSLMYKRPRNGLHYQFWEHDYPL